MKEMKPDLIATSTPDVQHHLHDDFQSSDSLLKVTVVDGHPVIVEAAVSLGGRKAKEGITVIS